jgi:hypothetical protein
MRKGQISPLRLNLEGQRFGLLTVVKRRDNEADPKHSWWECQCACGGSSVTRADWLRAGRTQSCGCQQFARNRAGTVHHVHGGTGTRTYTSWVEMLKRCYNPKVISYPRYGGVGVTVCDRWRFGTTTQHAFTCFLNDMGERPEGTSLDRKRNWLGYTKKNCRWATPVEQSRNRRREK